MIGTGPTAEQERLQFRKEVEDTLSTGGYVCGSEEELQDFVDRMGFEPDFLVKLDLSRRLALVIREAGGLDADDWLVEQVATRRANLQNTRVGLLLQHADLLGYDTVKGSMASGIEILILDSSGLHVLFGPNYEEKLLTIERQKRDSIIDRYSKNKRIPEPLSLSLRKISNLRYGQFLHDLSHDYERKVISSYVDETNLVFGYVKRIVKGIPGGDKVSNAVDLLRVLEELLQLDGSTRDHFFHQFQTFLLGSVILDANYPEMNNWHRSLFPENRNVDVDLVWVLASLCHDLLHPFGSKWLSSGTYTPIEQRLYYVRQPAEVLNSFYLHTKADSIRRSWNLDTNPAREGILSEMLIKHANLGNHGVNMALQMISSGLIYPPRILSSYICPAAMAIAFHDTGVWPDLIRYKIFPIETERSPVVSLLMYCDGLQEWGRPGRVFDPKGEHCALADLRVEHKRVLSGLWFKDKPRACLSKFLHDYVFGKCIKSGTIRFEMDVLCD